MLTINWPAFLPDLALMLSAFAAGSVFGGWMARRDYALELARLRALVPEAAMLQRLATQVAHAYLTMDEPPEMMGADIRTARALAARIEAAGAVTVPPVWEPPQTPTWRE